MYDEIQELKRVLWSSGVRKRSALSSLHTQVLVAEKESKNILVTRVRRQEEELLKKAKRCV